MASKQKNFFLTTKQFCKYAIAITVILFLLSIDYKNSNILHLNITFNSYSTNDFFKNLSKKIWKNDLVEKNQIIENFSKNILKDNNKIQLKENLNGIVSNLHHNVNKNNFMRFYKNYLKIHHKKSNYTNTIFGITPMHSIFKIDKYGNNLPEPVNKIEINVCKGEWESTQILVVPFVDSIYNIKIDIHGLGLYYQEVECFSGEYAYCDNSAYPGVKEGWFADPLAPAEIDTLQKNLLRFKFSPNLSMIKAGESKSFWLNYHIPDNVNAGKYNFEIIVSAQADNNTTKYEKINVFLNVFDFAIPDVMHLKTAFSFDKTMFLKYYNIDKISKKIDREHYTFFLKYHLNPTSLYTDISNSYPPLNDWKWCIENGTDFLNLGYLNYIPENDTDKLNRLKSNLIDKINYLEANNILQYAYVYGFDEVTKNDYPKLKKMVKLLHNIDNRIPFVCTTQPVDDLKGFVDIWVSLTSNFSETTRTYSKNERLWWYVCCLPYYPYANFFIEYSAIAPRIIFWQASKYNIEGFLYYLINSWTYNDNVKNLTFEKNPFVYEIKQGKRWPDIPWSGHSFRWNEGQKFYNGDGQLIYPGKDMKLCPSIRLINIRDGIEDYECLYQIKLLIDKYKKKNDKNKVKKLNDFLNKAYELVPSYSEYIDNPDKLLKLKKEALIILSQY